VAGLPDFRQNPELLGQARVRIENEQLSSVLPAGGMAPPHERVRRSFKRKCQAREIKTGSITETQ